MCVKNWGADHRLLMVIRKLFHLKFKIIFANGDALEPPSYEDFDQIQDLYTDSFDEAARFGIEEEKITFSLIASSTQLLENPANNFINNSVSKETIT